MATPEDLQIQLLKEALNDIRAVVKDWDTSNVERPAVFLVDAKDRFGKGFVEAYVSQEDRYKADAIQHGGVRADAVSTVIKAMPIEWADQALSKMGPPGQTLRVAASPNHIPVVVVAFGLIKAYQVSI